MTFDADHFSQALLDPDRVVSGLRSHDGSDCQSRFAVYRNNVSVSLVDALADTFAVVQELVGEDFFRAMALLFVRSHPPKTRILAHYGDEFAAFIALFEPATSLPYLADVARVEYARVQSYHAADVAALPSSALTALLTDPDARVALHPSLHVISSKHAAFSLWAAHQGAIDLREVDPSQPESLVTFRAQFDVETQRIPVASASFIQALQRNETLFSALAIAQSVDASFALTETLVLLVKQSLIIDP
jgi:hypothetical protein